MPEEPHARRDRDARDWWEGLLIVAMAFAVFSWRLGDEAEFVDEWAYVSQAYYLDLLADRDDPRWLDYAAIDLPPLPKYLIGAALKVAGYRLPNESAMRAWYDDTSSKAGAHAMLVAARWPSVVLGALGCGALYSIGIQAVDRRTGRLAGLLLLLDPLYRMHARRAMSDVPSEALALASLAFGLYAWRRWFGGRRPLFVPAMAMIAAGALAGLAVLAKLNGGLALIVLTAWFALDCAIASRDRESRWAVRGMGFGALTMLAGVVAFGVFAAGNPTVQANVSRPSPLADLGPIGRCRAIIEHRVSVSAAGQRLFPHDALVRPGQKVAVAAVQGLGRFGPLGSKVFIPEQRRRDPERQVWDFDSTRRFDWAQDRGGLLWGPLVALGAFGLIRLGYRQRGAGEAPAAWAAVAQAVAAAITVTAFLPLAWDRYLLPLQPVFCLLGAHGMVMVLGVRPATRKWRPAGVGA